MRLKGGKVLIDLTSKSLTDTFYVDLNDEMLKAIQSKGLSVLVKNVDGVNICVDLQIKHLEFATITYYSLLNDDGNEFHPYIDYSGGENESRLHFEKVQ